MLSPPKGAIPSSGIQHGWNQRSYLSMMFPSGGALVEEPDNPVSKSLRSLRAYFWVHRPPAAAAMQLANNPHSKKATTAGL